MFRQTIPGQGSGNPLVLTGETLACLSPAPGPVPCCGGPAFPMAALSRLPKHGSVAISQLPPEARKAGHPV
jgi:hypothetical protein